LMLWRVWDIYAQKDVGHLCSKGCGIFMLIRYGT